MLTGVATSTSVMTFINIAVMPEAIKLMRGETFDRHLVDGPVVQSSLEGVVRGINETTISVRMHMQQLDR